MRRQIKSLKELGGAPKETKSCRGRGFLDLRGVRGLERAKIRSERADLKALGGNLEA